MDMSARAVAAMAAEEVIHRGHSLSSCLAPLLARLPDRRDRAFAQECSYGVVRWFYRLDYQLRQLLQRPLRERDADVRMLLLVGLYQIQYLQLAAHAAVSETVEACQVLGKPWAKSLLNGVLRNALRNLEQLKNEADENEPARWAHPPWLIERTRVDWPAQWEGILLENNKRAPLTVRVNRQKISRDGYLALLEEANLAARPTTHARCGVQLVDPVPVDDLPRFAHGYVSVQDEAAQLAAQLLDVPPAAHVLDACAAPGGKTSHILETAPGNVTVTAVDNARVRLDDLEANLHRLGLQCQTICADTARVHEWWDGKPFDRILLDAPCSATGVIRRHPDIKLLRKRTDLDHLVARQLGLLDAVWPLLNAGGKLLYATCAIIPAENDGTIETFLERTTNAQCTVIEAPWGQPTEFGRQILPGVDRMDGFYYACIAKH